MDTPNYFVDLDHDVLNVQVNAPQNNIPEKIDRQMSKSLRQLSVAPSTKKLMQKNTLNYGQNNKLLYSNIKQFDHKFLIRNQHVSRHSFQRSNGTQYYDEDFH